MPLSYVEEASARLSELENLTKMIFVEFALKGYSDDPIQPVELLRDRHLYALRHHMQLKPMSGQTGNELAIQTEMIDLARDWFEDVLGLLREAKDAGLAS